MHKTFLTTLALSVLTTPALAQMNHGGMNHTTPSARSQTAMTMDLEALNRLSGRAFDRAFLSMMIPHHQAAVAMSQAVLGTKDAQVKAWASAIIRDQNREIAQMTTLLQSYGGVDTQMAGMMKTMMGGMVERVKQASNKDLAFVQGMLPHHASAVAMANLALQKSQSPSILKLARDIVRAQAQEMYEFRLSLLR
ncbi:DUF305 domain-containing protein [Deinococcus sp. YIM 77859]|uniref:DUF305 domain-containing protein n=1 Tax=Deinococcus sp. YIM 77859 TaxID=1540221 RepID=UPI0005542E9B|nr:DUF305 domain-containing protein [Deinococcus sp. YIM 77859]